MTGHRASTDWPVRLLAVSPAAALAGLVGLLVLFAAVIAPASEDDQGGGIALTSECSSPGAVDVPGLTSEQTTNARIIITVATRLRLSNQAMVVAIATAMQESTLRNLPYGDRDSLGLFQQRAA
ncbi:MAG: hypothetical protein ACRCYU_08140, partial [Nocardioides sp.]